MTRPRRKDRHLPPCVYQKHGAYYHVKGGKWRRLGVDLPTALQEYARVVGHSRGGMPELIEAALPIITRDCAASTVRQYTLAARKLQAILAEFAPQDVQPRHMAQLRRAMADHPNMTNRTLTVARLVFDYAVEEQLIASNPCVGIKRLPEAKRRRLVAVDEYHRIHAAASPRLRCIMDLLFLTGQRVMDVVRLRRRDLQADGIYFGQQKTGAQLVRKWTPDLRAAVDRAMALGGGVASITLFRSKHGRPPAYSTVRDEWREACTKAGVPDTDLRDIRAMAATHARRQGINATALLGHKSAAMTERYLRDIEVPLVDGPFLDSFGQSGPK